MKIKEIKEMTLDELAARKRELRTELFQLRLQQQSGQLEKPSLIRDTRREAARVETIRTQKSRVAAHAGTPAAK